MLFAECFMFTKCLYYGARQIAYLPSARVYALGKYYCTRRIPGFRSGTSMFVVVLFFEKKPKKSTQSYSDPQLGVSGNTEPRKVTWIHVKGL